MFGNVLNSPEKISKMILNSINYMKKLTKHDDNKFWYKVQSHDMRVSFVTFMC